MARIIGPDPASRLALRYTSVRQVEGLPGKTLTIYTDEAGTVPASIAAYQPGSPTVPGSVISGSKVVVGQDSQIPLFWFPDGVSTLYAKTRDDYTLRLTATGDATSGAQAVTGIINVKNAPYGAKGDGTTNDTAAIQSAMNAAAAAGLTLHVPPGLYRVAALEVPHGLRMEGAHPGGYGVPMSDANQTRFGLIAGTNTHMLHGAVGVAHVRISGIHFDGNKNNNTSGNIIHLDDASPSEEGQWHIRDCFIDAAAGAGIHVGVGRRCVQISDCTINYSRTNAITINGSDGHIDRCIIGSNQGHGITVGAAVTRISDCDIYGNGTAGNSSTGNGIHVSSTISQVVIHGCGIDRNLRNGVFCNTGSTMISIAQCTLHSNSQDVNGAAHHINVNSTSGGINVIGCAFQIDSGVTNQPANGIYLLAGATATAHGNSFVAGAFTSGFTNAPERLLRAAAYGTYANRPAAAVMNAGAMFAASDAGAYVSNGTAWSRFTSTPRVEKWYPANSVSCNIDRASSNMGNNTGLLTSGRLQLAGGLVVPAGSTVTNIAFLIGNTAPAGITNQWFCLVDQAGNVLGKTADVTNQNWSGNAVKTLALTTPYTAVADIAVYAGLVLVGTTMPDVRGSSASTVSHGILPMIGASANTGLTDPSTLGATTGAFTSASVCPFAYLT